MSYAYAGFAYGGGLYAGSPTVTGEPNAILALEANDRHQTIALIADGTVGAPMWVYWCPALAPWGEVLREPDYPAFFARNRAGIIPTARCESRIMELGDDGNQEFTIHGVEVDFTVRPDVLDDVDGGPGSYDPTFSVQVQGWGVEGVSATSSFDGLTTAVVESSVETWTATASSVSMDPWQTFRSASLPCSLEQAVRRVKINVTNVFGVEFLEFRVQGTPSPARA